MQQNHAEAMDFLASLHHSENFTAIPQFKGHFEQIAREQAAHDWQVREQNRDLGLTTEINTSKELMPVDEVVERCSAILRRHQYGYKDGVNRIEDKRGARQQAKELIGLEVAEVEDETAE